MFLLFNLFCFNGLKGNPQTLKLLGVSPIRGEMNSIVDSYLEINKESVENNILIIEISVNEQDTICILHSSLISDLFLSEEQINSCLGYSVIDDMICIIVGNASDFFSIDNKHNCKSFTLSNIPEYENEYYEYRITNGKGLIHLSDKQFSRILFSSIDTISSSLNIDKKTILIIDSLYFINDSIGSNKNNIVESRFYPPFYLYNRKNNKNNRFYNIAFLINNNDIIGLLFNEIERKEIKIVIDDKLKVSIDLNQARGNEP